MKKKRDIKAHEKLFGTYENKLSFRSVDQHQTDGVSLTDDEREYLLPHFLMLLVGKPGSGKTTLLKQLLTNPQMYYRKFDDVFIVSPSHAKMGIPVKAENTTANFSLDWLFEKFETINEEQEEKVFGNRVKRTNNDKKSMTGNKTLASGLVLGDSKSRFLLSDAFASMTRPHSSSAPALTGKAKEAKDRQDAEVAKQRMMQSKYDKLKKLPTKQQEDSHRNVLVVLDDVVGQVKKAEFDPRLSQLVMNRRHIIFNGTISLIVVTQKYTLIPARVRSNANWLILYQLNPMDFETAYRDAVTMPPYKWNQVLHFVYGIDLRSKPPPVEPVAAEEEEDRSQPVPAEGQQPVPLEQQELPEATERVGDVLKGKKFENLGIWVEANMYFKNFKRIMV